MMKTPHTLAALMQGAGALLAGCAGTAPQQTNYSSSPADNASYGVVDSVQLTRVPAAGSGAVAGGLVGALLGNQVGSGNGRSAATVVGAVGGAMAGNEIEKNRAAGRDAYQISVRLDNGDYRTIVQDSAADLRPNPPKLRLFSNFSDSSPCAVFGLGLVVLRDFHGGDRSDRQSSRAL
ncbi:glycine zipper 2TM domain-containing protein, partial [Janthinobacterium sp.]|uniref:glycine zipper 2TM domain-containing protein n=1 Tax=Janthinobacterium sp. TaxID=1871054 RepID=UPI00293D6776